MTKFVVQSGQGNPGLFQNAEWTPGTPGTFAVVIGVSDYPWLEGGSRYRAGDEAFGLGQLYVSAMTAWSVFEWLQDDYDYPSAPPAQCWLLLSPTTEEQELLAPSAATGAPAGAPLSLGATPATLANCESAIRSWDATMSGLGTVEAAASRGLIFFCGHGLEVAIDAQILLPSDYLSGPGRPVNDAISTANIIKAMWFSPVPNHFLFFDACRNDVPRLREYVVQGRQILNERPAALANPDAETGALYASASGAQTWQPRTAADGISLFGRALVDGLQGMPGMDRNGCDGTRCEIRFDPLKAYVEARVAELLTKYNSPEKARIRQGGSPPKAGITLVPDAAGIPAGPPAPPPPGHRLGARYDVVHANLNLLAGAEYPLAHDLMGSERMTDIWAYSSRIYDLSNGAELPRESIVIREVHRSEDTTAFRIAVELPRTEAGVYLHFTDPRGSQFATSLAGTEPHERPVYEFTIDFDQDREAQEGSSRSVSTFEARLSRLSDGELGRVAKVWNTYEARNVTSALAEADAAGLMDMVRDKLESPLTATIAAVLLFRARQLDRLPAAWLDNLADWFSHNADGSVLRAERARLEPASPGQGRIIAERLGEIYERGLPRIAEVLQLAWRQAEEVVPPPCLDLRARLHTAMSVHRPGGLFAVYASPSRDLSVGLVLPR